MIRRSAAAAVNVYSSTGEVSPVLTAFVVVVDDFDVPPEEVEPPEEEDPPEEDGVLGVVVGGVLVAVGFGVIVGFFETDGEPVVGGVPVGGVSTIIIRSSYFAALRDRETVTNSKPMPDDPSLS